MLVNESKQRSFGDLLFQRYASELNLSKVLRLLGKEEPTHEQLRGWFLESNGLQTETHYLAQSEMLRAGLIRFADAYGDRKVRELCGRLVLPRSPYEDTVFQGEGVGSSEESIRRDAMRRLNDLPLRRSRNPRRER